MGARIRFGAFEADTQSGELFRDGQRIPLPNQSFLALCAFLERPGQLVSRDELRGRLWPDQRVVEFEQGINAIVNRLRDALGDSAGNAKYIETLPRRGYRFIAQVEGATPLPEPRTSPRLLVFAVPLAFAVFALLAAAILKLYNNRSADVEFVNPSIEPLTSLAGREVSPTLSPDGGRLAFGWNGGEGNKGKFDLYSKRLDSERTQRLTNSPANALSAAWAPDGARIAFARMTDGGGGIYLIAAAGGEQKLLAPAAFVDESFMQLSWSPDGKEIAYASRESGGASHIRIISSDGRGIRQLPLPTACFDAGMPAFTANGLQLAFVCTTSVAVYSVYVFDLAARQARPLGTLQGYPRGLAWTSDCRALIVANDDGDGSALWQLSLAGRLARLPVAEEALGPGLAVSARRIAFVREKHLVDIWRVDLTMPADPGTQLISSTRMQLVPQYSPDGAHVAFESTRSGSSEIWIAASDGHDPVRVTHFNGPATGAPAWCADSRRIAFDSRASGASAIYLLDVLEGRPLRLDTQLTNLSLPVWSEDCQWIFASDGRSALYRIRVSGGPAEKFTDSPAYRAAVSGQHVIFNVAGPSGVELRSKPAQGGAETPLEGMAPLMYSDSWTAVAEGIYYTQAVAAAAAPLMQVSFYDFSTRISRTLRNLQGVTVPLGGLGITVSGDRHWLLYTRTVDWQGDIILVSGH